LRGRELLQLGANREALAVKLKNALLVLFRRVQSLKFLSIGALKEFNVTQLLLSGTAELLKVCWGC
jgi:hypothetical protein